MRLGAHENSVDLLNRHNALKRERCQLMRIVICEDNKEYAEILEEMVRRWADKEHVPIVIGRFESAE